MYEITKIWIAFFQVLNLFLALLLNAFAGDNLDKQKEDTQDTKKLKLGIQKLRAIICCCFPKLSGKVEPTKDENENSSESNAESKPPDGANTEGTGTI